ncbi:hypothetical protein [Pseudomonas sp. PAMC 25886]|uniref:hypothetical protein n=1 Tax=Pseudomonas sp. PAMC 25886 TaxID=1125977 RepID=UPI001146CDA2|nr:hypothetical protein [Pseudomonas sp. PAMC 25886]
MEIHWLKILGALLLIFAGVYLPVVASNGASSVGAVSAMLSAVGGALLADAFVTSRRFLKSIAPRLVSINRLLATITSQIGAVILEEKKKANDNHAINRLSEMVPGLRAIIADLNDLAEKKFDPNVLNETSYSVGLLITQIESGEIKPSAEEFTSFLKGIQDALDKGVALDPIASVSCPYDTCEGETKVELGEYPSTKVVHCVECKKKYHAVRKPNGSVETKVWGGSAKMA